MASPIERSGSKVRATIKDVAKAAGVSAMTVSNVLNGRMQFVSAATKRRVEREIARLGYRRQASARSLRVAEHRSIGMVIVDESPFFLADHFTCQVVAGLANVLNAVDYTLTLQGMRGDQLANSMIMRSFEVAGFCAMISGTRPERLETIERLSRLEQPLVVFQETATFENSDICVVRQDDYGGGRLLADHLLARRVSRYLVVVPRQGWPAIENRVSGLRDGLSEGSSVAIETVVSNSEGFDDVQAAIAEYVRKNPAPDAVVGANDAVATAAMHTFLENGYRVPEDVRVVGFNGFEAHRYTQPRLTTVVSAPYELGECAGRAMLRRIEQDSFDRNEFVLPVIFQPSQST